MDLWVWIAIFIVAWLLEALSSAAKNKQRRQQQHEQQQQQRQPRPPGGTASPPQARRVPPMPRPTPHTVSLPSPRSAPPPPPIFEGPVARPPRVRELEHTAALESTAAVEGVSAEMEIVEPAFESTEARHTRVTARYRGPAPGEIGGEERQRPQARFTLRPRTAREAIVWMEILGPPKSERA